MRKTSLIKFFITFFVVSFIFTIVCVLGVNALAAEEVVVEATPEESVVEATGSFVAWLKTLDAENIKAWIIGIIAKLGIDTAFIFSMLIYFVKMKVKEAKQSQFYNDLIAKMDADSQKKIEDITNGFVTKLEELESQVTNEIKKANSEERKLAKENVEKMKEALSEITIGLDK